MDISGKGKFGFKIFVLLFHIFVLMIPYYNVKRKQFIVITIPFLLSGNQNRKRENGNIFTKFGTGGIFRLI